MESSWLVHADDAKRFDIANPMTNTPSNVVDETAVKHKMIEGTKKNTASFSAAAGFNFWRVIGWENACIENDRTRANWTISIPNLGGHGKRVMPQNASIPSC